jgi:hypothetical protein
MGSRLLEEGVAHLQDFPPPKTISQLRRFLGMLNFYRRFLPQELLLLRHHSIMFSPASESNPIAWMPERHKAFKECKASLSHATLLAHHEPSAQLALVTDASTTTMGYHDSCQDALDQLTHTVPTVQFAWHIL